MIYVIKLNGIRCTIEIKFIKNESLKHDQIKTSRIWENAIYLKTGSYLWKSWNQK